MKNLPKSKLTKSQTKKFKKEIMIDGKLALIVACIRYDDNCNNGHNSFAITGEIGEQYRYPGDATEKLSNGKTVWLSSCGCIHDKIKKYFPEFEYLIKWHLCNSDGPMHYIANTVYHAKKIEKFNNFVYFQDTEFDFKKLIGLFSDKKTSDIIEKYRTVKNVNIINERKPNSTNKESDIKAARSCAIWPEATLDQLQDKQALMDRLLALMQAFKKDIESIGFIY